MMIGPAKEPFVPNLMNLAIQLAPNPQLAG